MSGSTCKTSPSEHDLRHVALLQIQGKEFKMTPLPLRTVRPFVIEDLSLAEAGEEHGIDLNDPMEITKFLKSKVCRHPECMSYPENAAIQVNELIRQADELWDKRNAQAVEEGEDELPRMLPLVRLKV